MISEQDRQAAIHDIDIEHGLGRLYTAFPHKLAELDVVATAVGSLAAWEAAQASAPTEELHEPVRKVSVGQRIGALIHRTWAEYEKAVSDQISGNSVYPLAMFYTLY